MLVFRSLLLLLLLRLAAPPPRPTSAPTLATSGAAVVDGNGVGVGLGFGVNKGPERPERNAMHALQVAYVRAAACTRLELIRRSATERKRR